ncbi:hypothetical protein KC726_05240 [Candidatus Woesebacteria bacterium]|nr:hypothetical protein [Candidatus Woesebacteria bacterium]
MYTYKRKNLPKHTITFTVSLPWKELETAKDQSFKELCKTLQVEGFRKGKVPKDIAKKHIPAADIYQHAIRSLLPKIYEEIVKKENIKPIISPKIDLKEAEENKDWTIVFTVAERPTVDLKKYKEQIKKAKAELKKSDIWVPGKDTKEDEKAVERKKQLEFQAALDALMKEATVEVPDLIIEDELEQRLSRLVDDIQRVGLTMESYLKSKNKTKEQLNNELKKEIENTYRLEFILQEIAEQEKITVDDAELETMFKAVKDDKERELAKRNAYYYASLLRKQKTLDYIQGM